MGIVRYLCITIFLVFLSVSVSADKVVANAPTAGCSVRGRPGLNGVCLCESGYGGANCEETLACGPEIMMPSSQTATLVATTEKSYPKLDELHNVMNFTGNTLTASIFGPVVANRTYTDVKFVGATRSECSLGTAGSFWKLSADEKSCADRLAVTMPWVNHTACGWVLQNNIASANVPSDVWQFKSTVLITYVDILNTIEEVEEADEDLKYVERRSSAAFHLYVNFHKFVTVAIEEVVVYAEVNLTVAITKFDYNPDTMILTVTLHTVLQWPNQIRADPTHQPIVTVPSALDYVDNSLIISSASCSMKLEDGIGSKCLQVIEFQVNLAQTTDCNFNGEYSLNATVATCRDDGSNSTTQDYGTCTWKFFEAFFWIQNSDICGSVEAKPTLAAKLEGFADAAYTIPSAAFNLGERGYFSVDVDSVNDLNLTFVDIYVQPEPTAAEPTPNDIYFLKNYVVQDKANMGTGLMKNPNYATSVNSIVDIKFTTTNHGVVLQELDDSVKVWAPRFNFQFEGWVFRPEVGQSRIYTLRAKAKITYRSNEYNDAGKRAIKTRVVDYVWKEAGANARAAADYSVSEKAAPSATVTQTTSSNSVNMLAAVLPVAGVALVAIVGAIVVAVIIVKRKKATAFRPFN